MKSPLLKASIISCAYLVFLLLLAQVDPYYDAINTLRAIIMLPGMLLLAPFIENIHVDISPLLIFSLNTALFFVLTYLLLRYRSNASKSKTN
jgi:hypothetical protein